MFKPGQTSDCQSSTTELHPQKLYKGWVRFFQGPLGLQPNALPLSYIPAAYRFNNITANTLRLFEHWYQVFCSESSVLSRSMSFFSSLSKIIQGDTRVRTRDLSDCSRMLYHWAISPLHTDSISLQITAGCKHNVFCSESSVLSRSMSFFSSLSKIIQGVWTRDLSDALPLSYMLHTDSITSLQTPAVCLSTVTMFFVPSQVYCKGTPGFADLSDCSESSVLSQSISPFSNITVFVWALLQCFFIRVKWAPGLSKIIQGDTRDFSDCSRMLYHWAIYPLQTDSKTSLQTREGCLSTVTMFFVPSQVYSRDRCHFSLVFQKLHKGTPVFGPETSQTAANCSTTELYPRCIQIQ